MAKNLVMTLVGAAFAAALWLAPSQASAANCNFNKNEKIAMVSWIIPIAGAVMTPLACKRDLFNKKSKGDAALPAEHRKQADIRFLDRRRHRMM
ncbi:MAG TPA: hypothetical protein VFG22_06330 [Polyangiales bacterium]|jgi:hypothetical protein|nr:hypothetical protein [Polyangiales bacterium]